MRKPSPLWWLALLPILFLLAMCYAANAACPTTSLTFKDAAGVTQTLCFGGASGAFIPQYQILDAAGTNALGINASGQIGISNFPATQPVSGTVTANAGTGTFTVGGTVTANQGGAPWSQNVTQWNSVALGSPSNYGTSPGAVSVPGVNAFVTNTPTVSGTVTANQGGAPWSQNVTQFGGVNISTGTGASGTGIPRVTISNDSSLAANQSVNLSQVGGSTTAQGGVAGSLLVEQGCAGQTVANTNVTPVSITSATTTTQLLAGVAAKKIYICSINLVAGAADNVALVEASAASCGGTVAGMAGGSTTTNGWNFAANGGLTLGSGQGIVAKTATAADNVCLLTSSAGPLSGTVVWAQF